MDKRQIGRILAATSILLLTAIIPSYATEPPPLITCGAPIYPDLGSPATLDISVQAPIVGLSSIVVVSVTNGIVPIPSFEVGTTGVVIVILTQIDQRLETRATIRATNTQGSVTVRECVIPAPSPVPEFGAVIPIIALLSAAAIILGRRTIRIERRNI